MFFVRQGATHKIVLGPAVSVSDGITPVNTLTLSGADNAHAILHDTATVVDISGYTFALIRNNASPQVGIGYYHLTLQSGISNTCGHVTVICNDTSLVLPLRCDFTVVEEAVYDELFAASALGYVANAPVNVAQISGDSTAADNLETAFDDTAGAVPWTQITDQGTAQSATATTLVIRAAAAFANDELLGQTVQITGGSAGVGQSKTILDYVSSTDTITVSAWQTTPSGTITYKIFPTPAAESTAPIPVNVTQIAGAAVDTGTAQIGVNVVALDANAITATSIASDAITAAKIAAGAIDAATFAADVDAEILSYIVDDATRIDASDLNSKVDSLTFTVAGQVDANAVSMNDVTIIGAGTSGNLWRA